MPLYIDDTTDVVSDYPENIGEHPVLGAHLSLYTPDSCEYEEDKVVVADAALSTQRLQKTAKLKAAPAPKASDPDAPKDAN